MGQISSKLRLVQGGYAHWCPACKEMHFFRERREGVPPPTWIYDGNHECPTFHPSMDIHHDAEADPDDPTNPDGIIPAFKCHYILTAGVISFCSDCTHAMKGQVVPLPDLPERYWDRVKAE